MSNQRYRIIGTGGSPYSMKLRAIMRYRHIPHDWIHRTSKNRAATEHVKPNIIPMLRYPGEDRYRVDSTPPRPPLHHPRRSRACLPQPFVGGHGGRMADQGHVPLPLVL